MTYRHAISPFNLLWFFSVMSYSSQCGAFYILFHYWIFTAHNPSQRTELEKLHIEKGKQIYLHIFLYTHTWTSVLFYHLSVENHPFTLSFPIPVQYHKVHSDFISVSYNFLSSVRNLSLFSLIISTYSINPAFQSLVGLQYLKPDHCHCGDLVSLLGLWHCTQPRKHPLIQLRLHHVEWSTTPIPLYQPPAWMSILLNCL